MRHREKTKETTVEKAKPINLFIENYLKIIKLHFDP